jgi:hypothetical protein
VIPQGQWSYEEVIYRIIYQELDVLSHGFLFSFAQGEREKEREREREKAMSEGKLIHDIIGELFIQKELLIFFYLKKLAFLRFQSTTGEGVNRAFAN